MTTDLIATERLALADLLATLTPEQWGTQSLCGAWTVKDVAVHLLPTLGKGMREFLGAVVRARGNLHRASESLVATYSAQLATDEIVASLREHADDRFAPPGVGANGPYTDVLVHGLDIAVPLGLDPARPAESWRTSLDFLVSRRGRLGFVPRPLPAVTLRATDLDWSHGSGPEVVGPAQVLGLTLCRAAGLG